ncbi:MAG: DUF262 domain-containing protein [Chloroflexota bacterium]
MFDTTKDDLKEILRKVAVGRLQLPDFQRDYVWGDADVRSLIASIAKGFPVGALLTLEAGGPIHFKPRPLQGVPHIDRRPDELLLDGQQRMTSLYQSFMSPEPVRTTTDRGGQVERYYYLDINKAISGNEDFEDAIVGVPRDRIVRGDFGKNVLLDLSSRELEFERDMFPLNQVFDAHDWIYPWRDFWRSRDRDVADIDKLFYRGILERIDDYKMPIIRLDRENSREAICLVFEKVNVGGKKLDAFELVTAIYAADEFDLRQDWNGDGATAGRRQRMIGSPNRRDVLAHIASTDFLQACTLLHTREVRAAKYQSGLRDRELPQVSCRREALLGLPLDAYQRFARSVEQGFIETASFLNEQHIIWHKDIPYPPQLVALASVFAIMGNEATAMKVREQLAQWFWCAALGELYGSSTESRLARDVPELVEWLRGSGPPPRSIDDAIFQRERLRTLRVRISAAYKGIHALLMQSGCRDFISGKPVDIMTFFNDQIDIHHIFPQDWCKKQGIPASVYNSIINKTALSKRSNILIGGDAPSVYLGRIQERQDLPVMVMDGILRTHLIEPQLLREDRFDEFFEARSRALAKLVTEAMRKSVVEELGSNELEIAPPLSDLLDQDDDLELAS